MLPPSAPPPGWGGEFCGPHVVKLGLQTVVFCASPEHVLRTINLLSSLAGCGSHATIVLLFKDMSHTSVAWFCCKQACLVLSLSKPVLLSNCELTGVSHISPTYSPLMGLTI